MTQKNEIIAQKKEMLYEGKAKILYKTDDAGLLIQYFKDDTTAFNKQKFEIIEGKGILNNEISTIIMKKLKEVVPNHFVKKLNEREQLVLPVKIIPLEVVVRNVIAGSFAKNFGLTVGEALKQPLVEFFFKKDELNDPIISPNQIECLEILNKSQIAILEDYALKVNAVLREIFTKIGFKLVDFKIEFGFDLKGNIILADEISPDSCRLWDVMTGKSFDKDVFRKGLGNIIEYYSEVLERLQKI
jgi:phosphoribosylaminoimidazole-succinocarboxamide synthase